MNFLYPDWFYALIFIPLIMIIAVFMRSNRTTVWKKMVGTKHQKKLINTSSKILSWISFGISLVALTGFIITMARPYKGQTQVRDKIKTRNIVIAVDCSLSMLCKDGDSANTNRLNTAKTVAIKLVDAFPDDHIGVMAFAGSANMISSITIDHPSVKQTIELIDIYSAHTLGSNFSDSVTQSIEALEAAGKSANALILITDGTEDKPDIPKLASRAKKSQVQIFTIGVGSTAGGPIPIPLEDGKVIEHKDQYGRAVITKLEDSSLRHLATETSGSYSHSSNANKMIAKAVKTMEQFEKEGRVRDVPHELYQWFLAPSILLLIISVLLRVHWKKTPPKRASKPTVATASLIFTLLLHQPSEAQQNDSFFSKTKTTLFEKPANIRQGYKALESKKYPAAIQHLNAALAHSDGQEHAHLSLALAQAHYRNGNYTEATKAYGDAIISSDERIQVDAQYNMGNALFRTAVANFQPPSEMPFDQYLEAAIRGDQGVEKLPNIDTIKKKLQDSISKYSETLQLEDSHSQAHKNKQVAEKLLSTIEKIEERIRKQEEQKQDKEKKDPKEEEEKKDQDKKDQEDGEKSEEQSGEKGEKSEKQGDRENEDGESKEDKSGKEGDPKNSKESQNSNQSNPDNLKQKQPNEAKQKSEFANEQEALKFMEKMSDQRKKPVRLRRSWRNSGNDW